MYIIIYEYKKKVLREQTVNQIPSMTWNSTVRDYTVKIIVLSRHFAGPQPDSLTDSSNESRSVHSRSYRDSVKWLVRSLQIAGSINLPLGFKHSRDIQLRSFFITEDKSEGLGVHRDWTSDIFKSQKSVE